MHHLWDIYKSFVQPSVQTEKAELKKQIPSSLSKGWISFLPMEKGLGIFSIHRYNNERSHAYGKHSIAKIHLLSPRPQSTGTDYSEKEFQ